MVQRYIEFIPFCTVWCLSIPTRWHHLLHRVFSLSTRWLPVQSRPENLSLSWHLTTWWNLEKRGPRESGLEPWTSPWNYKQPAFGAVCVLILSAACWGSNNSKYLSFFSFHLSAPRKTVIFRPNKIAVFPEFSLQTLVFSLYVKTLSFDK